MIHNMKLNNVPFSEILTNTKTIELRLFDQKRSTLNLGDTIVFTNTIDYTKTITVEVTRSFTLS